MRKVSVIAAGPVVPSVLARATSDAGRLLTLADVLAWAREHRPPLQVVEIVTQDEYTHDVVLPFDGSHFLAFDAT